MAGAESDGDDAAIAAAIAELGRPGPLRTDDVARGRVVLAAFQRRRRRAALVRTTAITAAAVAAAIVLVMVRFGPDLRVRLGAGADGHAQSELAIDGDEQGGDSVERRLPVQSRSARDAAVEPPAPVEIAPVDEPPLVVEDTASAEPVASVRKPAAKSIAQGSAGDMLAKARALTRARKLGPAVAAYEALIDAHPASAEARAACVSLGRVQLQRGRAKPALRAFDRYLAGGSGSLGEEAHWGRIQALHALGRGRERDLATSAFAKAFPGSMYLPKAKSLATAGR